jgi:hypothetical protein
MLNRNAKIRNHENVKIKQCEKAKTQQSEKVKCNNAKSEHTTDNLEKDDIFYVSYSCSSSARIFAFVAHSYIFAFPHF